MVILNSIRRNLAKLIAPESIAPGITASHSKITASLPVALGGSPPEISLSRPAPVAAPVASAAPTASGLPRKSLAELGISLTKADVADAFVRFQHQQAMRPNAARPVATRPAPLGKAATPPPALEDDNQTPTKPAPAPDPEQDPSLDAIISQLLDLVLQLKKTVQVTAEDDTETQAALGHFAAGRKLTASKGLMAATKRMCERPKITASQRIARGFSAQDSVKAIQACLRPARHNLAAPAARAGFALAPVAGGPAQPAASTVGSRDRVQAIRAEIAQLDREQRKQFTNERNAKHLALTRELRAEMKKFHVQ